MAGGRSVDWKPRPYFVTGLQAEWSRIGAQWLLRRLKGRQVLWAGRRGVACSCCSVSLLTATHRQTETRS